MMAGTHKITTVICALALAVNIIGTYAEYADASSPPVTSDDAGSVRQGLERGDARNMDAKAVIQQLLSGKKVQGRLVSGDDGQQYQITLKSSGQLDIRLEGDAGKLSGHLTDRKGKSWDPRKAARGKYTYQLNKGTYYYQIQAAKGAKIPGTGLDYAVTATFQSAKAKFENNTTRKKAALLPFQEVFYGHLASNASVEYYKFTLDKKSYFSFSLTTQITDYTPETFVVTLYNKYGKRMSKWENPDWVEYFKYPEIQGGYQFVDGDWYKDGNLGNHISYDRGRTWVLPAGDYYVGVSIKRDKTGKVSAARYGQYAAFAAFWSPSVSVHLSNRQTEYTGKRIAHPKVTIKKLHHAVLERKHDRRRYRIYGITVGTGANPQKIGRYIIEQNMWSVDTEFCEDNTYAYAIFTVTPIRGKINQLSSKKPGEIQVSVKKNAQSTGYQIQIAHDKKFKKSVRTLKTENLKETLKGLLPGKKYYVRMRNYKDVKTRYYELAVPESIYGKWSKTRTIVCK